MAKLNIDLSGVKLSENPTERDLQCQGWDLVTDGNRAVTEKAMLLFGKSEAVSELNALKWLDHVRVYVNSLTGHTMVFTELYDIDKTLASEIIKHTYDHDLDFKLLPGIHNPGRAIAIAIVKTGAFELVDKALSEIDKEAREAV